MGAHEVMNALLCRDGADSLKRSQLLEIGLVSLTDNTIVSERCMV